MTEAEIDWRTLAIWLLECQAATSERYNHLKSAAKVTDRRRHAGICQKALTYIKTGDQQELGAFRHSKLESVIARAENAVKYSKADPRTEPIVSIETPRS